MASTTTQLAEAIETAMDNVSDIEINPAQAREQYAKAIAQAVSDFVIGRKTKVVGSSATGGPVKGTGVIQ